MKLISKIYLYLLAVLLSAWLLPWTFRFLTARPTQSPLVLYSCVKQCFALKQTDEHGNTVCSDMKGNTYTVKEFDSILPTLYYRQLVTLGNFPDTLCGIPVSPEQIYHENFHLRITTRDINQTSPCVYMVMESMPSHVDLEEPLEAFRMGDEMTFIRMADNSINRERSELFTKTLKKKGFVFPAHAVNGNPTVKKQYDEGYLIIDDRYQVFHVKQMKGRPYVRNTGIDPSLKMKHVFITEFPGRKTLALLTDEQNHFYALTPKYELHRLPLDYQPEKEDMIVVGDLFNWTVKISDRDGSTVYAVNADTYQLADRLHDDYQKQKSEKIYKAVFPFSLSFTSHTDEWVKPRIGGFSVIALPFNLLLAAIGLYIRRKCLKKAVPMGIAIALLGIFLFIPMLVIGRN